MVILDLITSSSSLVEALAAVFGYVVALLAALVLHEVSHGLVALWNGDITAKFAGRLSVSPFVHFDPLGLCLMLVCGFGWAKPVPVNPNNFKKPKLGMFLVSGAGIVTNILLAFLLALPVALMQGTILPQSQIAQFFVLFAYFFCRLAVLLNISLALFNLLPFFPLDGWRLLGCAVGENNKFMQFLRRYGMWILLVLMATTFIPVVRNYSPFSLYMVNLRNIICDAFYSFWGLFL